MPPTQQELALQMIAQLRLLDPSVSADIGTPERKIIDTVSQALADAQIDLVSLRGALDLDAKYGDNLDRFLALFGFARRGATVATGFVTFSRVTASTSDIRIPSGTQIKAVSNIADGPSDIIFYTTFDVTLPAGETSIVVPIQAALAGTGGNVAANTVTQFVGTTTIGITAVTNDNPTSGGTNAETDEEFKVRFKTQVFRNLAGTQDQYLALASATAYTTKINVIGSVSRYLEYIQVPSVDDSTPYDVNGDGTLEVGGGNVGEYTTALSDVPYSKYTYTALPSFVSSGSDADALFYRENVDYVMNTANSAKNRGDTKRESSVTPQLGYSVTNPLAAHQPNVTFLNVYTGIDPDISAVRPGDVVLFEHSYVSSASRNDIVNGISNAVDIYVDGGNDVSASVITTRPSTANVFVNDSTSKFHYENYRRIGEPEHRPVLGNILLPLYWEPVTDLPDQIVIEGDTYTRGTHFWPIEDISTLRGTIRARNGIEFTGAIRSLATGDTSEAPSGWTGAIVTAYPSGTAVPVDNYFYDRNVVDLQTTVESNRQVTTDVLVHKAMIRYFKFDVSVMYTQGSSVVGVNTQIRENLRLFLETAYFGQVVQLSDILQVIHEVPGVDNVRWSSDIPGGPDLSRVYETDVNGNPLTNVIIDMISPGYPGTLSTQFQFYFTGAPTGGSITLAEDSTFMEYTIAPTVNSPTLQTALRTRLSAPNLTVSGTGTPDNPFVVDYHDSVSVHPIPYLTNNKLTGGSHIINTDFFLADDQLPALPPGEIVGDSAAGLIIRPRAQNTFTRA